ncbi:MAG: hypothetical protein OSB43_20305 [Nocardioides sp.]|uniref:hypothetical protein n=1 Tax=Nocardioides sp. TaxID=35761 RepID=UPI000C922935|nr:hypothetical protein [Nocardioides sp.]MAS54796.1 hypothetical protein [Pimelobacter sp.]MDE0778630.1 hypothetical protein [Nocardioides sp.]
MTTPLGEQLATWLEALGLGAHLGEAGLPTYERDGDGRARWSDPVTAEPLSTEQLQQLDAVLRSQGDDPDHAVPLPLLQLKRAARVRADLLDDEWLTYATLAERRGTSLEATRFTVHKDAADRRLLVLREGADTVVPAFQLTDDGAIRPELEPLLAPLLAAGMDPWRAWAWLARPAALLGGQVPEQAVRDPEESEIVVRAAIHLAARVVIGGAG